MGITLTSLSVKVNSQVYLDMSPKDTEVLAMINTIEVPSAPIEEEIVYQRFGDMELPDDEEDDGDYSPSDVDSDDSLEWASETERTMLEDALAEGNVGINYADAAVSMTTEYLASFKPVQMGLGAASVLPLLPLQRAARAAKRAGAKNIDVVPSGPPSMLVSAVNSILSYIGIELAPAIEDSSKPHLEPGTEPFTLEQEFGEMTLSDYDSDEDADYEPTSDEDSEEDELEFDSGASVSSDEEVVVSE